MRNRGLKSIYQSNARTVLNVQAEKEKISAPGNLIQPGPSPIIQQPIQPVVTDDEYLKKMYSLSRSFTPAPGDVLFDHTAYYVTSGAPAFTPTIGNQLVMYTFKVPSVQRFVITGFCFFILFGNAPVTNFLNLCEPYEHIGELDFLILVNGKLPVQSDYRIFSTVPPLDILREGWSTLSIDPERDSNSTPVGYAIPVQPGAKLEVILRNHAYIWLGIRDVYSLGFRMRGFFSDEKLEKK